MEDWIKFKDQKPSQNEPFWFLVIKPLHRIIGIDGQHIQIESWEELKNFNKNEIKNYAVVYVDVDPNKDVEIQMREIMGDVRWRPVLKEGE
jgi:hypothetical protein